MNKKEIELLDQIKAYIQKSRAFIWPLLKIDASPLETYLRFGNVIPSSSDRLLIALFYNQNPDYLNKKYLIEKNKYYDFTFSDKDFDYVVFNCNSIKDDYDKIIAGEYSKLSNGSAFYLFTTSKNKTVIAAVNPNNYYQEYEAVLDLPKDSLKNKELLQKPRLEEETINVSQKVLKAIIETYCFKVH